MGGSTTKKIAKNYSWLLGGGLISGTINFVTNVVIARVLGVVSFGWLRFAQAFLTYLVLVVDSGLSTLGTIEISKAKDRASQIMLNLFSLRLGLAVLIYALALTVLAFLPLSAQMRWLFILTFLYVFYRALNADWAFQGIEKMEYIAIAKVAYAVIYFILIGVFIKTSADLLAVPLIQALVGIVLALIFLLFLRQQLPRGKTLRVETGEAKNYFCGAIPLGASAVLIQIYNNMDTIMLGLLDKAQVVGYYNAAYQIYYVVLAFFILWQSAVIPVASKKISTDRKEAKSFLEKYLKLTLLAIIPATIAVFIGAPLAIKIFFGSAYLTAIPALRILIWTMIPCAVGYSYGALVLIPAGDSRGFLLAVGGGAVVNIVLNFLLIPQWSYAGSALATIMAETTVAVFAVHYAGKILQLSLWDKLMKPVFFSLLAVVPTLALYFGLQTGGLMKTALLCSCFTLLYLLLVIYYERVFITEFVTAIIRRKV